MDSSQGLTRSTTRKPWMYGRLLPGLARKPPGQESAEAAAGTSTGVDRGRGRSSLLRPHTGLEVDVMSEPATAP
jgi:hypothetical protein